MYGIAGWHLLIIVGYLIIPIAVIVVGVFLVRGFLRRRENRIADLVVVKLREAEGPDAAH